jgi:hypothetical protein
VFPVVASDLRDIEIEPREETGDNPNYRRGKGGGKTQTETKKTHSAS